MDLSVSVVDLEPVSCTDAVHPRLCLHKGKSKKHDQEKRREELLSRQKEEREKLFNEGRDLVDEEEEDDDAGGVIVTTVFRYTKPKLFYKNKLMLSEWMLEVPKDLADQWYVVPCPRGRRNLVVSNRGRATAYNIGGHKLAVFPASFPGRTVLDCIWLPDLKMYYILDVLVWNGQVFLECETEFRVFWLNSKLTEEEDVTQVTSYNHYPFHQLKFQQCTPENLKALMTRYPLFPEDKPSVDGLLFYHKAAHYKAGLTPLVLWLEPFMMPEVLGVPIAIEYDQQRPDDYQNLSQYLIKKKEERKVKRIRRKTSKMDISEGEADINLELEVDDSRDSDKEEMEASE